MHLFVENLTNVDFSYLHPTRGLLGETWLASIALEGVLDEQGMVCDFGIVKKTVRDWLDATIDHSLVVPEQSQCLVENTLDNDQRTIAWQYQEQTIRCQSPTQAITMIDQEMVDEQTIADWCITQLRELLPDTIDRIKIHFKPEAIEQHFYHYSHGLKKHRGNCQRIAHGHRSTIEIRLDNERRYDIEEQWCQYWRDIYIGSDADLVDERIINNTPYYQFSYTSEQGPFALSLPKSHCYLIPTDSTVELIAEHIASKVAQQYPTAHIEIKAFEGIGKGAIAYLGTT